MQQDKFPDTSQMSLRAETSYFVSKKILRDEQMSAQDIA
jgi:hypothetical protein